jgi:hypothetical protein
MTHAKIREIHLMHKYMYGQSKPCPCQYCVERRT